MTNAEDHRNDSSEEKSADSRAIIDATAHRRPRVHGAETDFGKGAAGLEFLANVPLKLNVVLGETTMSLGEVVALETDSIIQLEKPSGDPLDVYIENQRLGTGEVIVLHEKLRIRVLEVTPPSLGLSESQAQKTEEG